MHLQVQLAGKQEQYFARCCDAALTVSQRFQHWLRDRWSVQARVLYDKAPSFFQPASAEEVRPPPRPLPTPLTVLERACAIHEQQPTCLHSTAQQVNALRLCGQYEY